MNHLLARRGVTLVSEWTYVLATIAAFVFLPEVRRIVDWRGSFDPLNTFAVIPLFMLLPIGFFAFRRRSRLRSRGFALIILTWLSGFAYGTIVAIAHNSIAAPLRSLAEFCLPVVVGVWLLTREESASVLHARLAAMLLSFGGLAAAYGIVQYVFAPPWDTAWMQDVGAIAFGTPEPFGIRVFGVLNGPEVFALFLTCVVLFNLPHLRMRNVFHLTALFLIAIAIMLSLFRTAWIAVILGVVIYVCLSPKRLKALLGLVAVAGICLAAIAGITLALPQSDAGQKIVLRFTTLSDVQDDYSFADRQATREAASQMIVEKPTGTGLGTTGGSGKLASADAQALSAIPDGPIDNGFVSRLLEMGVPGFSTLLLACCLSIAFALRSYVGFARRQDAGNMLVVASCIVTQLIIVLVNLSDDDLHGLFGIIFFAAVALPLLHTNQTKAETSVRKSIGAARISGLGYRRAASTA